MCRPYVLLKNICGDHVDAPAYELFSFFGVVNCPAVYGDAFIVQLFDDLFGQCCVLDIQIKIPSLQALDKTGFIFRGQELCASIRILAAQIYQVIVCKRDEYNIILIAESFDASTDLKNFLFLKSVLKLKNGILFIFF